MALKINGESIQLADPLAEIVLEIDESEDPSQDPQIRLTDTAQADPAGRFRIRVSGDSMTIQRSSGAGWSGGTSRIEINGTGIGFFAVTPVAQGSAYTQTYATADKTHNAITSADFPAGGTGAAAGGWDTASNRDLAITRFNALRAEVIDLKNLVNSVIDDLQALGLVG